MSIGVIVRTEFASKVRRTRRVQAEHEQGFNGVPHKGYTARARRIQASRVVDESFGDMPTSYYHRPRSFYGQSGRIIAAHAGGMGRRFSFSVIVAIK